MWDAKDDVRLRCGSEELTRENRIATMGAGLLTAERIAEPRLYFYIEA